MSHEMDLIYLLRKKGDTKNKKGKRKGCFGNTKHIGTYQTLKVIPKNQQTKENCNKHGVSETKEAGIVKKSSA